jgi:hypothetical protein
VYYQVGKEFSISREHMMSDEYKGEMSELLLAIAPAFHFCTHRSDAEVKLVSFPSFNSVYLTTFCQYGNSIQNTF